MVEDVVRWLTRLGVCCPVWLGRSVSVGFTVGSRHEVANSGSSSLAAELFRINQRKAPRKESVCERGCRQSGPPCRMLPIPKDKIE